MSEIGNNHEVVIPTGKDITLECKDCGSKFTFTKGEQQFFADRHLSQTSRCPNCRKIRREKFNPPMSLEQAIERVNSQYGPGSHQGVL